MRGYINGYDPIEGVLSIIVPDFFDTFALEHEVISDCEVNLNDGRTISNKQRRAIHAMVHDIGNYVARVSNNIEYQEMLRQLKLLYVIDKEDSEEIRKQLTYNYCDLADIDMFSLKDCDMTTARNFLTWLIDLAVTWNIPCNGSLIDRCEDIDKYLYACLANKKCCICGRQADLHHAKAIGAGRNRKEIAHIGIPSESLCREHHNEAHTIGQHSFDEKYHVHGIKLDETLCKVHSLKTK